PVKSGKGMSGPLLWVLIFILGLIGGTLLTFTYTNMKNTKSVAPKVSPTPKPTSAPKVTTAPTIEASPSGAMMKKEVSPKPALTLTPAVEKATPSSEEVSTPAPTQ